MAVPARPAEVSRSCWKVRLGDQQVYLRGRPLLLPSFPQPQAPEAPKAAVLGVPPQKNKLLQEL